MSITRGFADTSNVERVIFLQSALHADSVSHSMSSVSSPRSFMEERFRKAGIRASNSGSVGRHGEHLTTLGLSAAASKQEIKQAYRRLALKYHPDVCKGDHCTLMFKQVNSAYENALEAEEEQELVSEVGDDCLDGFVGATDDGWEDWEEWMGWEGAGITDYSSHINPSYSF